MRKCSRRERIISELDKLHDEAFTEGMCEMKRRAIRVIREWENKMGMCGSSGLIELLEKNGVSDD